MQREVFIVRGQDILWRGEAQGASTQDYFAEAWRRALAAGQVAPMDAGIVQFRFSSPDRAAVQF
jgi:hypothetical protein